jgi:hypothetical protein
MALLTYGWRILKTVNDPAVYPDYINTHLELRELVAGCMERNPRDRPTLGQLQDLIMDQMNYWNKAEIAQKTPAPLVSGQPAQPTPPLPPPASWSYDRRVTLGEVEPTECSSKFYQEYFYDSWPNEDPFDQYWGNPTLPPLPPNP